MAQEKPPFIRFDRRAVEDRDATIEAGHYVGRDVDYAIITPVGSRDTIEREVTDWFRYLEEGVNQERIPSEWLPAYRGAYKAWKEGREVPEEGTPILTWGGASPAQIKNMIDIGVRTVEHLAQANEETLGRMGMGGRALKQKAEEYLTAIDKFGKTAEILAKLKAEVKSANLENEKLRAQLDEAKAEIKTLRAQVKEAA